MIETALDSFKNRPTTSSFSKVNIDCKHKLDSLILNLLGLNSFQSNQLFGVLANTEKMKPPFAKFNYILPMNY